MQLTRSARSFRLMTVLLAAVTVASCKSGGGGSGGGGGNFDSKPDRTPEVLRDYVLVWSDEFNSGTAPDPKYWTADLGFGTGGWGNDESQEYTADPSNLRVEDGNLIITARCTGACGVRDGSITSARINTKNKFEFKYGKVQARIKVPAGKSTWPAFWMLGSRFPEDPAALVGDEVLWPAAGEIDIMEVHQFYSDIQTSHFAIHWLEECIIDPIPAGFEFPCRDGPVVDSNFSTSGTEGHAFYDTFKTFDFALSDDYHIYELEWNERSITGKIDGITYFTEAINQDTQTEFLKNFFLILNLAVDGSLGGPPGAIRTTPQEMMVDWVRVYQKPTPVELSFVSDSPGAVNIAYRQIINSVIFGGNSVESDINSTVVAATEGDTVMEVDYTSNNASFSGAAFQLNAADLSDYSTLKFALDKSRFGDFSNISVEFVDSRNDGGALGKDSVLLAGYTPRVNGNWAFYEIPLSDYSGVNFDDITLFGFWNPVNSRGQLSAGKLFLDDIRLVREVSLPATFDNTALSYTFSDFDGGAAMVVDNPQVDANNGSAGVVQMLKDGGLGGGGSTLMLDSPINFSVYETLNLKALASRAVRVLMRLEGTLGSAEVEENHGGTGWEDLEFDFSGLAAGLGDVLDVALVFDNGVMGDVINNPADWTFYFDDLELFRLPNDSDGDGFVYLYGSGKPFEFVPDTDYIFSDFDSGSSFAGDYDLDPDFGPVFAVTSGTDYDLAPPAEDQTAVLALAGFDRGFAAPYANLVFKIKDMPNDNVTITFSGADNPIFTRTLVVDLTNPAFAADIPGTTGWKQVTVPLSNFAGIAVPTTVVLMEFYNNFSITGDLSVGAEYTFLITDIAFTGD